MSFALLRSPVPDSSISNTDALSSHRIKRKYIKYLNDPSLRFPNHPPHIYPFTSQHPSTLRLRIATMHQPTCVNLRVRTPLDAHTIFHAVHEGILPMITRRLDTEERRAISSGCVYVWEERGASAEATGVCIHTRSVLRVLALTYHSLDGH